MKAKSIFLG